MAKQMNKKINTFRWAIFAILGLGYFFVYFHRLSLPVVANELVRDFQTTASVMGLLGSIYFYCYAAMQIPAGLLSDSLGPRKTVTFSLLIASAGSILFGMASGIGMAFVGRVMVGLGVSMVFIPTMKIISRWFRADEFALMAGLLNAIGGAGALGATWVLALMTGLFGWRVSFELIGAATFALLILVWIVVRDRPEDKGWPPLSESANEQGKNSPSMGKISLWDGFRKVISERYFWPLAVWYFFDCGIFFGFGALERSLSHACLWNDAGRGRSHLEHDSLGNDRGKSFPGVLVRQGSQKQKEGHGFLQPGPGPGTSVPLCIPFGPRAPHHVRGLSVICPVRFCRGGHRIHDNQRAFSG